MQIPTVRAMFGSYRVAVETVAIVAVLVAIRAVIWNLGITGMSTTPLASSIIGGGVFVMGLVVAGTLSDYRDAERAPTDIAASLYALLREAEAMNSVWGKPDLAALRNRLIAVVTSLRSDINAGNTRDCQEAVEDLSVSLLELEESDVPANYIVRLRAEQAALRKATLRMYHIQREAFLPSAKAMITSLVLIILVMLMFTDMGGQLESLVTLGFLAFFFVYLLRIINVIDKPFKVGKERTDDDVSLFLLTEFVVHAHSGGEGGVAAEDVAVQAEALEQRLVEVEEAQAEELEEAAAEEAEHEKAAEEAAADMVEHFTQRRAGRRRTLVGGLVAIGGGQRVLDALAGSGQVLFASSCQLFAAFPQLQRRIQVQPALLELPHDFDQFIAGFFIPQLTNGLHAL